jgi:hypothetical protein
MKSLKLITTATVLSVAVAGTAVAGSAALLNTTTTTQAVAAAGAGGAGAGAAVGVLNTGIFAGYTAVQLVAVGFVVVGAVVYLGSATDTTTAMSY